MKEKLTPRAKRLLRVFLLTEEKWQIIFDFQKGLCGICKRPMMKPNTDHCHIFGTVRGLLCPMCNQALGKFRDDPILLAAALEFLTNPPATQALGYEHRGLPGRVDTKKQRKLAKKLKKLADKLAQKELDNISKP